MLINSSIRFTTEQASGLVRAVRLVYRSTPGWTILSAALIAVQGMLPLLSLYLMKLVVDAVARRLATANPEATFGQIALFVIFAGVTVLVGEVCYTIAGLVSEAQSLTVTDYMHDILHAKSIEADVEYYENSEYYDTLHRAQQEAPFRPTRIVHGLLQVGQSGISLVAMAGLLLSFHWGVAVIIMAAVTPGMLVRLKYAGRIYRWRRQRTPTGRQAAYAHDRTVSGSRPVGNHSA